ncbi:unnamed protein product [Cuscuta campestris]|uniref:Chromo domain-containing protein n=1 Tax=Cuscuta campestris TaxID=132261 RepID=A0A484LPJ1_9ASTE|nr:unnamed protein product [Cuscuta campestris]
MAATPPDPNSTAALAAAMEKKLSEMFWEFSEVQKGAIHQEIVSVHKKIDSLNTRIEKVESNQGEASHVRHDKPFHGTLGTEMADLPPGIGDEAAMAVPEAVLGQRRIFKKGRITEELLVRWTGGNDTDATWEERRWLEKTFPTIHLEDKVVSDPGGDDTRKLCKALKVTCEPRGTLGFDMNRIEASYAISLERFCKEEILLTHLHYLRRGHRFPVFLFIPFFFINPFRII